MTSNLPAGVTNSMIDGGDDAEWEKLIDSIMDKFTDEGLDIHEANRAILVGIAAVKAERYLVQESINAARQDERMCAEMGV